VKRVCAYVRVEQSVPVQFKRCGNRADRRERLPATIIIESRRAEAMQTRLVLATFAVGLAAAAPRAGVAADLAPPYEPPAYVAPVFASWTGFYVGLNAGYAFGTSDWDAPALSLNPDGGLVGGTIGYNVQSGSWVFGLEGDIDWADIRDSSTTWGLGACETKADWFATARGRVGYAFNSAMLYATAGGAFAEVKASNATWPSTAKTMAGWTVGGGVEYAFSGNWSAKVEYLYSDLGTFACGVTCGSVTPDDISFTSNMVRGGINYRF
jgi:outer membrane immunogenic protein